MLFVPEMSGGVVVLLGPESQNGWRWKSDLPAIAGSHGGSCPGPCPYVLNDGHSTKYSNTTETSLYFQNLISQFRTQLEKVFKHKNADR